MKRLILWLAGLFFVMVLAGWLAYLYAPEMGIKGPSRKNRIGVIEVTGSIVSAKNWIKALKEFREDESIKAIVLRVDSPGGGIGPSQELYRELRRTIDIKPVVTSMGSVAASGGYYIASGTSRIVANPGTITGSIGVISYFPNLASLFDKIGYNTVTIKSGRYKDIGNPSREMTPEERNIIQGTINEAHSQFVRDIAKGRNLPEEKVGEFADGRIIMGESAQRLGLVDELGNFEDAVSAAALLGKIDGEPVLVHVKKKTISLIDILLGDEVGDEARSLIQGSSQVLRYQMPTGF